MAISSDLPPSRLTEFDLISRYFSPLAGKAGLGLLDDAACVQPQSGTDLIISKDMLVSGRHFFSDDAPENIGFKALSANVSDLAAKGAKPQCYLLGLSLSPAVTNHEWLSAFAGGLAEAQKHYGIELVGGDTTATDGPLTISITAFGGVKSGQMLKRSGAQVGDDIYVSGTIGDASLALEAIESNKHNDDCFLERFHRPLARTELGQKLIGIATASVDVSDGLLADIGHICKASQVGAQVYQAEIPLSKAAEARVNKENSLWPRIWAGGDDYEIAFTAKPQDRLKIKAVAQNVGVLITRVGQIGTQKSVELVDCSGELVQVGQQGYQHF